MMAPGRMVDTHLVQEVRYFAVYPDGRRVSVTEEAAIVYGAAWLRDDGVKVVTQIRTRSALVFDRGLEYAP